MKNITYNVYANRNTTNTLIQYEHLYHADVFKDFAIACDQT